MWALVLLVLLGGVHAEGLDEDEGYCLIVIDSDLSAEKLTLRGETRRLFKTIDKGRRVELIALPAGDYYWSTLRANTWNLGSYWRVEEYEFEDRSYGFSIEAGKINYPGDLVFRWVGGQRLNTRMINRMSMALDYLYETHPGLVEKYGVTFSGGYPDRYPGFYESLLKLEDAHVED